VLVDPDRVEEKNLNRILNSGKEDAYLGRHKVYALASAIARMGLGQEVLPMPMNLISREAVMRVAECDVVFGCMDGVEGRHMLNRLATFYTLPYFDVGVRLDATAAAVSTASRERFTTFSQGFRASSAAVFTLWIEFKPKSSGGRIPNSTAVNSTKDTFVALKRTGQRLSA
jgi:tRNA A37 threonylcarbamoyladenosine dehydratase